MEIILAGKNTIAVDVMKYILYKTNCKVSVVLNRNENYCNGFQKSLGYYAKKKNVEILALEDVYKKTDAVFLSLEYDRIVKPDLFKTKKLFNIHFSLLPAYKGMYTSALPILNGENITGVTLHKIDHGIDTGEIIAQQIIEITDYESAETLYNKYITEGTSLVIKNIDSLVSGILNTEPQAHRGSSYYSKKAIDYVNLFIDYNQTAENIGRQLRAFSFRSFQLPKYQEKEILSYEILDERSIQKPGMLIEMNEFEIIISTIDYNIKLITDCYKKLWEACNTDCSQELIKIIDHYPGLDLEVKSKEGWTALIIAAFHGSMACMKVLIDAGANINACNYNNTSVLMYAKSYALKSKDLKPIDLLLKNSVDLNHKDIYDKTVFDWLENEDPTLITYLNQSR